LLVLHSKKVNFAQCVSPLRPQKGNGVWGGGGLLKYQKVNFAWFQKKKNLTLLDWHSKIFNFAWFLFKKKLKFAWFALFTKLNFAQFVRSPGQVLRVVKLLRAQKSQLCSICTPPDAGYEGGGRYWMMNKSTLLGFHLKQLNFARFYCEKSQLCSILQWEKSTSLHSTVKRVKFAPFYCENSQLWSILILLWKESTLFHLTVKRSTLIHFDFTVNWVNFAPFWF
jgi:hypothetical protein